jgi:hypothetical protein
MAGALAMRANVLETDEANAALERLTRLQEAKL